MTWEGLLFFCPFVLSTPNKIALLFSHGLEYKTF